MKLLDMDDFGIIIYKSFQMTYDGLWKSMGFWYYSLLGNSNKVHIYSPY